MFLVCGRWLLSVPSVVADGVEYVSKETQKYMEMKAGRNGTCHVKGASKQGDTV